MNAQDHEVPDGSYLFIEPGIPDEEAYVYFVSFSHRGGFGNTNFRFRQPINAMMDIRLIQKDISERVGAQAVTVLNYQLLREPGYIEPPRE